MIVKLLSTKLTKCQLYIYFIQCACLPIVLLWLLVTNHNFNGSIGNAACKA